LWITDGHARIEAGEGILEDHLHFGPQWLKLGCGQLGQIDGPFAVVEQHFTGGRVKRA
jgi:hypothetical protein